MKQKQWLMSEVCVHKRKTLGLITLLHRLFVFICTEELLMKNAYFTTCLHAHKIVLLVGIFYLYFFYSILHFLLQMNVLKKN